MARGKSTLEVFIIVKGSWQTFWRPGVAGNPMSAILNLAQSDTTGFF